MNLPIATSGMWIVKPAEEDAFAQEWTAFVTWPSSMPESGAFAYSRDFEAGNATSRLLRARRRATGRGSWIIRWA